VAPSRYVPLMTVPFWDLDATMVELHRAAELGHKGVVFPARMDDFRLTFMHGQVAGSSAVRFGADQFARIRPLNELAYAGATATLAKEWKHARGRAGVEPRLMVFLANVAAVGILTVKGMVESLGDPLLYSDEQLIEGLAQIFEAAATP